MFKPITIAVAILGLASIASADRGDRYSPGGGRDVYANQRREASVRYETGSRQYDRTYGRYGQATYGLRTNYDRDYGRRYDAGYRYSSGSRGYSSFSFGFSTGGYGDSVRLGYRYSSGGYYPRYAAPVYVPAPVYVRSYVPVYRSYGPVIYDDCPPVPYYAPSAYYAPVYAAPSYGGGYYYESRGYYSR